MDGKEKKRLEVEIGADFGVERTPAEKAERRKRAARWGHVTRRLMKNERLTDDWLVLALSGTGDEKIAEKLKSGEPLSDYEKHLMIDL